MSPVYLVNVTGTLGKCHQYSVNVTGILDKYPRNTDYIVILQIKTNGRMLYVLVQNGLEVYTARCLVAAVHNTEYFDNIRNVRTFLLLCAEFEFYQGLLIISCEEAILAYRTLVVLHM